MVECSTRSFSRTNIKVDFLNVKQMPFTLMNEEFEFLCSLMTLSFNKDILRHSQHLYSHCVYYVYYYSILLSFSLVLSHN